MKYRFYFLLATFLTLPFTIRKVWWQGSGISFAEYSDVSLYLFEIFLLGYLLMYILEHKIKLKSIYNVFHVEHYLIVLLLSASTLAAAFFEETFLPLAFLLKWILFALFAFFLYLDLYKIVPRGTSLVSSSKDEYCSTWNIFRVIIIFSLMIQSLIILFQVIFQRSVNLFWLGEGILSPRINGVATVIFNNQEFLRGYGTFLHPNIAAFFFFSYTLLFLFLYIVPRGTRKKVNMSEICSTWSISHNLPKFIYNMFHMEHMKSEKIWERIAYIVPRGTTYLLIIVVLIAFLLTFSKSVIFISLLLSFYGLFLYCSTWNNSQSYQDHSRKLFHVEQFSTFQNQDRPIVPRGTVLIILILFLFITISLLKVEGGSYFKQSILERKMQYLSIPIENTSDLLRGNGLGSYVEVLSQKSPRLFFWQLQPIHNTFILAAFEIGLLPILLVCFYAWRKWQKKKLPKPHGYSQRQFFIIAASAGLVCLLSIDHYMWDIEQGQFLLIVLLAVLIFSFKTSMPKNIK